MPLASDKPGEAITNVFTTTELADDSRRAQLPLPMGEDLNDAFPIGAALDLSSKDKVYKPIPTDEIEQSPGPLPGLWVLNNEGVLSSWWVVYNESIRTGTAYPGIAAADSAQPSLSSTPKPAVFGSPAPSAASPFGAPTSTTPAFGGASALGSRASAWSTTPGAPAAPAFGQSAFGTKPAAPAFGQSSTISMGIKASPWASGSTGAAAAAFGQSGFASSSPSTGKIFGSGATTSPSSGGFANFASKGGFSALGGSTSGSSTLFGSKPAGSFAASTPEVSMDTSTSFPVPAAKEAAPSIGSSPFVLGTTFKADPKSANDNEKPTGESGGSLFGGGFGLSLNDAATQPAAPETKDVDMDKTLVPNLAQEKSKSMFSLESTTPTTTPAPQRFAFNTTSGPAPSSNIFGVPKPAASSGMSNIFGNPKPATSEVTAPKSGPSNIFGTPGLAPAKETEPKSFSSLFGTPKIKQEEEDKENLSNIPEAPLPPDTTSKAAFPLGESSSSGSSYSPDAASKSPVNVSDAPLPPDFVRKPLPGKAGDITPPEESSVSELKGVPEAAPLPPDFVSKPKSEAKASPAQVPIMPAAPESPGSDLSEEGEAEEGEEDEGDEDHEEEEEGEESGTEANSEGSGIDVAKDLSPTTGFGSQTPGFTPQSSFGKMAESGYSTISRSEAEPSRSSLFGEISRNAPPLFPKQVPQSPRSPSPVRGAMRSSFLRPAEPHRSVSAPGVASQLLGRRTPQAPSNLGFPTPQRSVPAVDPNVKAQRKLAAAKKEAEERVLIDPEYEGIQKILQSEIEPTLHMHEFLAVDSKLEDVGTSSREEVPIACETLWRDINRMVDRLGLNSRSLESFIRGHSTMFKEGGRSKEDLEAADDWVLVEAEELGLVIEQDLAQELEEGRVKDVEKLEAEIQSLSRGLVKLRAKDEDLRKVILSHVDPDQVAVTKSLPLSAEQATQQNELRRAYGTFTKLLSEAEEALTMLRAKVASAGGASGKTPVPTVEAIIRTINKMTSMAEKRSGDIDVLENQMRRLRLGSVGPNGSPAPSRSREGSPFTTPQKKASIFSLERKRDSIMSSPASFGLRGTPPRKKLSQFTEEEKKGVVQKDAKRRATLQLLRASLEKSGPNVSRLRDDE